MPLSRLQKAHSQRMYFLQTLPTTTQSVSFLMAGASGNVYTVTIPLRASQSAAAQSLVGYGGQEEERLRCNCVDHIIRKSVCKHMLFICLRVLRFSEEELQELQERKCIAEGRLSSALGAINAGLVDARFRASSQLQGAFATAAGPLGGESVQKRMPDADDRCPVCCDELKHEDGLAHCLYGCGKALHHECFERYATSHRQRVRQGHVDDDALRCVFCRAAWEPKRVGRRGLLAGRRLINLAETQPEVFEMGAVADRALGRRRPTSGGKRRKKKDAAGSSGMMTRSRAKRRRNC